MSDVHASLRLALEEAGFDIYRDAKGRFIAHRVADGRVVSGRSLIEVFGTAVSAVRLLKLEHPSDFRTAHYDPPPLDLGLHDEEAA
jgi:hypothetical protein